MVWSNAINSTRTAITPTSAQKTFQERKTCLKHAVRENRFRYEPIHSRFSAAMSLIALPRRLHPLPVRVKPSSAAGQGQGRSQPGAGTR